MVQSPALTTRPELVVTQPCITLPPTQAELPYDDGMPMESHRHKAQMDLLIDSLSTWLGDREDGYVSGNMFVYFSLAQVKNQDYRGPDFFVALNVPKGERLSWVVWEEGKAPDLVIELLSASTADQDKGTKKLIYQNQLRVSEYYWFDPFNPEDWAGFSLQGGAYQPIDRNPQDQMVSQALGLTLVRWPGIYQGIEATWLRWATLAGELLPTAQEISDRERQRADAEQQRADAEQQRADAEQQRADAEQQRAEQAELQLRQTVRNLHQAGMTLEQIAQLTGLTEQQIAALQD